MRGKGRSYVLWCGLVVVFLLALFPRLFYPASRYDLWYNRSVRFWDALLMGDLSGTYQQYHPGVTTMWIAGFGLRMYMAAGRPMNCFTRLGSLTLKGDLPRRAWLR